MFRGVPNVYIIIHMKVEIFLLIGPLDSSSWFPQGQQLQFPCTYNGLGGYVYASAVPPSPLSCSASLGQPFQRGIIRPLAKISQKHQQLWEAQV